MNLEVLACNAIREQSDVDIFNYSEDEVLSPKELGLKEIHCPVEDNPLLSDMGKILDKKDKRHVHFAIKGPASNTRHKSSKGGKSPLPTNKSSKSSANSK